MAGISLPQRDPSQKFKGREPWERARQAATKRIPVLLLYPFYCSLTYGESEWLRAGMFQDSGDQLGAGWGG